MICSWHHAISQDISMMLQFHMQKWIFECFISNLNHLVICNFERELIDNSNSQFLYLNNTSLLKILANFHTISYCSKVYFTLVELSRINLLAGCSFNKTELKKGWFFKFFQDFLKTYLYFTKSPEDASFLFMLSK